MLKVNPAKDKVIEIGVIDRLYFAILDGNLISVADHLTNLAKDIMFYWDIIPSNRAKQEAESVRKRFIKKIKIIARNETTPMNWGLKRLSHRYHFYLKDTKFNESAETIHKLFNATEGKKFIKQHLT